MLAIYSSFRPGSRDEEGWTCLLPVRRGFKIMSTSGRPFGDFWSRAMEQRFTRRFRVRHYELGLHGHVNNVVLVQHLQEAAIEASTAAGFAPEWYRDRGTGWVVRRLAIRYHSPLVYGEEAEVATWISEARGARATREYDVRRAGDGTPVARARVEWIYLDLKAGSPTRLPDVIIEAFDPGGDQEDLGIRLAMAQPTEGAYRYRSRRRVQFHELDTARHVHHAIYLQWIGQAYLDAMRATGHPRDTDDRPDWVAGTAGHEIQYFAPALNDDPIEIVSWICETGQGRDAWTHEVCHATTGTVLARDYSPGEFVTPDGKPTTPPQPVVDDVLRGPKPSSPSL
jgi:acyl-CoA thioester hydrolase